MRALQRLPDEPPGLAGHRAANPLDELTGGAEAGTVWNRFRDDPGYRELREALVRVQHGLCAYCEIRLVADDGALITRDQQVEHVLAKEAGAGRVLDWRNLVACCAGGTNAHATDVARRYRGGANVSCGQAKDQKELAAGCDPRTWPFSVRLVDIAINGVMSANAAACQSVGVAPADLEQTINDILNLNCERLRMARQEVIRIVTGELLWLGEELKVRFNGNPDAQKKITEGILEGLLAPDHHGHVNGFWTVGQQYSEPLSTEWLAQNVARFGSAGP